MNDSLAWFCIVCVFFIVVAVFLWQLSLFLRDVRSDRATSERRRNEHDLNLVRELGRQMLGTLRPGETIPDFEEQLPHTDPGAGAMTLEEWYQNDNVVVDPLDQSDPDPMTMDPLGEDVD